MGIFMLIFSCMFVLAVYKVYQTNQPPMAMVMSLLIYIPFVFGWMITILLSYSGTTLVYSMIGSLVIGMLFCLKSATHLMECSGMAMMSGLMGSMLVPMIPSEDMMMVNGVLLFLFTCCMYLTVFQLFHLEKKRSQIWYVCSAIFSILFIFFLFYMSRSVHV